MCEKCAGTGILGWDDAYEKWGETTVAARIPNICECETGLKLWLEANGQYVKFVDSGGEFKSGPMGA
jgi:hypothetical protein